MQKTTRVKPRNTGRGPLNKAAPFAVAASLALALPARALAQGGPSSLPSPVPAAARAPDNQAGMGFSGGAGANSVQSLLHSTDEEWQVISQLLRAIVSAQAAAHYSASEIQGTGAFGGMFGFGGGAGSFGKDSFSDPGLGPMGGFPGNFDWTTMFGGSTTNVNGMLGGGNPTNAAPGGPGGNVNFGGPGGWNAFGPPGGGGSGPAGGPAGERGGQGRGGAGGQWGGQTNSPNPTSPPGRGFSGMGGPGMGGPGMGGPGMGGPGMGGPGMGGPGMGSSGMGGFGMSGPAMGGVGFGGFGMGGADNPVATALTELRTAVTATNAAPGTIEAKIAEVHQARQKAKQELDAAQHELRLLVTRQQEIVLISLGYLE